MAGPDGTLAACWRAHGGELAWRDLVFSGFFVVSLTQPMKGKCPMSFTADAAKIKRWREERHWSQEHLAELAGIGLRTIQRIENGEPASQDSLKALAAAFYVDVMALSVDPRAEAAEAIQREQARKAAALRLSFFIHLASYVLGMVIFAGISIGVGHGFVMMWPAIWWTVGVVAHGVTVVIVELVFRHEQQYGLSPKRS